jgi:hypothetical protein
MESEGSLPSSQELSNCTYPEPDNQIQIQILYSFHKSITEQEFMGCGDRQLRVMDWHTDNR